MNPFDLLDTITALNLGYTGPKLLDRRDETVPDQHSSVEESRGSRKSDRGDRFERSGGGSRRSGGGQRYRVAVGHNHGASPKAIVGAITNEGGLAGNDLGKIEIFQTFSLVEIKDRKSVV